MSMKAPPPRVAPSRTVEQLAALGEHNRFKLVRQLAKGPASVSALAAAVGDKVTNTSHHLQVLRTAGLVDCDKAGRERVYRLVREAVEDGDCVKYPLDDAVLAVCG
jgi:ArsR family transcriptional regulator